MFNVNEFKLGLVEDVARLVDARNKYHEAVNALHALGKNAPRQSSLECLPVALSNLLKSRFEDVDAELTASYCYGYPIEIKTSECYFEYDDWRHSQGHYLTQKLYQEILRADEKKSPFEQVQLLEGVIHRMPWEKIKEHLDHQVNNVKNAGMAAAVRKVNTFFGLTSPRLDRFSVTKRGLVCSKGYDGTGYSLHDYARKFEDVLEALKPIAEESNINLGSGFFDLCEALWTNARTSKAIPLRTRFGKGSAVDVTVFTSKINMVISFPLLEAIQAATLIYGSEEEAGNIMKLMEHVEAA